MQNQTGYQTWDLPHCKRVLYQLPGRYKTIGHLLSNMQSRYMLLCLLYAIPLHVAILIINQKLLFVN